MNKIKKRTFSILLLVGIAILGMGFLMVRYLVQGTEWATAQERFNRNVYRDGRLVARGEIRDRNGIVLAGVTDGKRTFAESPDIRRATLHAVGDGDADTAQIGVGALTEFAPGLMGHNLITGLYSMSGSGGNRISLTIDARLNAAALDELRGRRGVVMVSNYKTGEILCMVSSPTFDPANPPDAATIASLIDPYVNHAIQSTYAPGSTFKLVTAAAAIENVSRVYDLEFECTGSLEIGNDTLVCRHGPHGNLGIERGMQVSCNIVFGELALKVGAGTMAEFAEKYALSETTRVSGIETKKGRFDEGAPGSIFLAWSGIGQFRNEVCPATMLRFVGAIGNNGTAIDLYFQKRTGISAFVPSRSERLITRNTAVQLNDLLDIQNNQTIPGLDIRAKTGTAQVDGRDPHAWYVGYISDPDHPYAFVVMVEHGGSGGEVARPIATAVLQKIVG